MRQEIAILLLLLLLIVPAVALWRSLKARRRRGSDRLRINLFESGRRSQPRSGGAH